MTTEHVALAMIHQSDPAVEQAGTNRKTGKKNFESVESIDDRRKSKMAKLEVILPKTLGMFKVAGIAEVKQHKKSSHVYLKLVDDTGAEPVKKIVETKENSELYDGALTALEQDHGLTKGIPKIVLCLRSTYWAKLGAKVRVPKAKKVEEPTQNAESVAEATKIASAIKQSVAQKGGNGGKKSGLKTGKIAPSINGKVTPASVR